MRYAVQVIRKAEKEYLKLSEKIKTRVKKKILSLEKNPRLFGAGKLKETEYFRLKVGDYRVIYSINDKTKKW